MPDIIQVLPDSVANQIAAGEVIQRPASVIKELVENAVDAGAQHIQVIVVDAGRTSIQVIDDGKGMSETDARLSFERHATSKIRKADDLFSLHTMGFRGEALPSIAAVAQVELKTRRKEDEVGTHVTLSGSKVMGQQPVACPVGSNFLVENLFFNVPARRKFLKSNATELNNILTAFERIVLVNPQIGFTFHSNRTELFNLRPCALRQRIVDVFGKKVNQDLLSVEVETTVCKIYGFVGKPESARKKGVYQFFFVNGRYMRHPYFHKAVQNAFERLVPTGEQVPYFIYFDVPAEDIDVNIHPTKTEIKFENEQTIWQILMAAVREAVGKFNDVPLIDFDTEGKPEIPVFEQSSGHVQTPSLRVDPQYNPFKQHTSPGESSSAKYWEQLYEGLEQREPEQMDVFQTSPQDDQGIASEKSPNHYQYKGCYIMTAVKSGLMIIDQHRAHVRILYDQYMQMFDTISTTSQKVLFPEIVQFPPSEAVVLEKVIPEMEHLGFELTDLGNRNYAINAVPAGLDGVNMVKLVQSMVATALEQGKNVSEEIHHALAICMARCAAIPRGQVLSNEEMEGLVNQLFSCNEVNYTPDGKPVLSILKQEDIEHLF
jgi:DNA mismatch repair protein MutL